MTGLEELFGPATPIQELAEQLTHEHTELMRALRQRRIAAGLTVEQVAERVGADPQKINDFEAYYADPTLREIRHYALATGTMIRHTVTDSGVDVSPEAIPTTKDTTTA